MRLYLKGIRYKWHGDLEDRYFEALETIDAFDRLCDDETTRERVREVVSACFDTLGIADTVNAQIRKLRALWVINAYTSNENRIRTEEWVLTISNSTHTWTSFLKDTRDTMTMAIVEDSCLETNENMGRICSTMKPKNPRNPKYPWGYQVLQTSIHLNKAAIKKKDSHRPRKIRYAGTEEYYWDLAAVVTDQTFQMGEQGSLKVLKDVNLASSDSKRGSKGKNVSSSTVASDRQSFVADWNPRTSRTMLELEEVYRQRVRGLGEKPHHTEAMDMRRGKPVCVLIISE